MDINAAFPSNYLRACDLQGHSVTVTMDKVQSEDIGGDHKPVLYFSGKERGLVLNKTNAQSIAEMYGSESDNWRGKQIILFPTQTDFQGRQVACIRVRLQEFTPPPKTVAPELPPAAPETDLPF